MREWDFVMEATIVLIIIANNYKFLIYMFLLIWLQIGYVYDVSMRRPSPNTEEVYLKEKHLLFQTLIKLFFTLK